MAGALLVFLTGCPWQSAWPPPAKVGVCRSEYQFGGDQVDSSIKAVIFYPDLGGSKPIRHFPLIVVNPGYSDSSTGLDYLGEALALAGFYVVSYDPQDGVDFLPQDMSTNVQVDWSILSGRLMLLRDDLLAAGYQVPGSSPQKMLGVIQQCLEGTMTDQGELDICKHFFDYRLQPVQIIIDTCQNPPSDLPGASLVDANWVGTIGYSLGGFTALQLAGAGNSLPGPEVKATLLMAPVTGLFTPDDMLRIGVPVTCLKAGQDQMAINASFDALWPFCPEPKDLVVYPDFGHLDFTETFDHLVYGGGGPTTGQVEVAKEVVKFFSKQYRVGGK